MLFVVKVERFRRCFPPHLELVSMPLGQVLYESDIQLQHAFFPTTSIVSLHYVMKSGASAEIASVGKEGMVGIPIILASKTTPGMATVLTAGCGYRLKGRLLMRNSITQGQCCVCCYGTSKHS